MARFVGSSSPSLFSSLICFVLSVAPLFFLSSSEQPSLRDVTLSNPVIHFVPPVLDGFSCERVLVIGSSRLKLGSYASALHVTLKASDTALERLHGKIEVCFHRNVSLGLCGCESDEWRSLQKGEWSAVISPYEKRYIDVKLKDDVPASVMIALEDEFQKWRLIFLGVGFALLLLAPTISNWVPFYFGCSMTFGVLAVVLLILFQAMKLLPLGKKNILYITLYGSALGVGSYIAHYFSTAVNSILVSFGLSEDMYNPVSILLLVGIVLAGAALGYWIVRKYVLSDDGSVCDGISLFVKWALRVFGAVFVLQSSLDVLLPVIALVIWSMCSLVTLKKWSQARTHREHMKSKNLWRKRTSQISPAIRRAEFLSRTPPEKSVRRSTSCSPYASLSNRPIRANISYSSPNNERQPQPPPPPPQQQQQEEEYYSTFHKTPTRKFSKVEWDDFTRESTREALAEWAALPEVAKWLADNAHRLNLKPEHSSDENTDSSSASSEETEVDDAGGFGFLSWR